MVMELLESGEELRLDAGELAGATNPNLGDPGKFWPCRYPAKLWTCRDPALISMLRSKTGRRFLGDKSPGEGGARRELIFQEWIEPIFGLSQNGYGKS